MDRQTILAVIHRQLRESLAETGEVRPLGEIVGAVAKEIRASRNGQVAPGVIPIETVAAFVDGNLSNQESDAVCRAVLVDNSVLAELVSAVRAITQSTEKLEPLPEVLRNQLLAMQASLPIERAVPEPIEALPIEALPIAEEPTAPTIKTEPVLRKSARAKQRRSVHRVIAILSLAAALAGIIFVATQNRKPAPEQPEIVQSRQRPETISSKDADLVDDSDARMVDSSDEPKPLPEPDVPMFEPPLGNDSWPTVVQQAPPLPKNDPPPSDAIVPDPGPGPPPPSLVKVTPLSGLRWSKVTGILARRSELAATSASQIAIWESVPADASSPMEIIGRQVVLQTLPLSRAEAVLESGGRLVLAADSGMEVSPGDPTISADVRLQYGDAALIDLPQGTVIRLIKAGQTIARLRWQSKASVVLQHAASGLEVHVKDGTIDINQQPHRESSVAIARDRSMQSIPQPKRLPMWVDRPVETINVKQSFLAQIGESRNVMGTLNEQIRALSQNQRSNEGDLRTMATLATWQAALAGENVFRLVGSRLPVVRLAAMNRLVTIPGWDPRHRRIWAAIDNTVRDKQRAARFRRLIFLAQQNAAPSPAQMSTMLDDLTAPDIASPALSDYLLRRFNGNAKQLPIYDPTATGPAQLQAANLWRRYLARNATTPQRAQPAAAVDRLRN